eukprot:SAG31_NODE_3367_length_4356_cov_1.707775_4_plen_369_part_00
MGLCAFGSFGVRARKKRWFRVYFVMLVVLFVLLLWVGIYFLFDRGTVVNAMKASLVNHWPAFYSELPAGTKTALPDCSATWSDLCWAQFEQFIAQSWATAGYVILGVLMVLPLSIILAGGALGLRAAVETIEESMAYVMVLLSLTMVALGVYCVLDIGGPLGTAIGPVMTSIGGIICCLAAVNLYELHHQTTCCCKKSTLEKCLTRCYTVFTVITFGIALWILTSESSLLTAVEDLCNQACLDNIIATFSNKSSGVVGNRTGSGSLHDSAERGITHSNGAIKPANITALDEAARQEFEADFGAKINDAGWFLLLLSLFLALQTVLNFGHMRCIKKEEKREAIPRDSVSTHDNDLLASQQQSDLQASEP